MELKKYELYKNKVDNLLLEIRQYEKHYNDLLKNWNIAHPEKPRVFNEVQMRRDINKKFRHKWLLLFQYNPAMQENKILEAIGNLLYSRDEQNDQPAYN